MWKIKECFLTKPWLLQLFGMFVFLLGEPLCSDWMFGIIARVVLITELFWAENVGLGYFPQLIFGVNRTESVTATPNADLRLQLGSLEEQLQFPDGVFFEVGTLWLSDLHATLSKNAGRVGKSPSWHRLCFSPGSWPLGLQPAGGTGAAHRLPSHAGVGMEPAPRLMSCYWLLLGHHFPPPFPIPAGYSWGSGPKSGFSSRLFIFGNGVCSLYPEQRTGWQERLHVYDRAIKIHGVELQTYFGWCLFNWNTIIQMWSAGYCWDSGSSSSQQPKEGNSCGTYTSKISIGL